MFAQRRNLVRPGYIAMLLDVMRFNNNAVHAATDPETTLGELFDQLRLGRWFRDYYFLPISGAIWSTATERMNQFPAQSLVRFFQNHALLSATGQHQWYTVQGGSIEYVRRLEAAIRSAGAEVRAGSPVAGVRRLATGAEVRVTGGAWEHFDDVVFATHSDVTLRLLADPSADERQALGAIRYQPNIAVLHRDADQMPRNRGCWASWVYKDDGAAPAERIPLTYWMNSLQPIPQDDPLFVTLNPGRPIPDEAVFDVTTFQHPVYDLAAQAAQRALRAMQGRNRTWFCGAYLRHGFHEDGYASAVEVAGMLGTVPAWA
jgi:predicted NAD/FAD-binding protein